jgi:hypothetical protein
MLAQSESDPMKRWLRQPQFSLRVALLFFVAAGVLFLWLRRHQQINTAWERIYAVGGMVSASHDYVWLDGTKVDDRAFSRLIDDIRVISHRVLSLRNTSVGDDSVRLVATRLLTLTQLDLSGTSVTDGSLASLPELADLQELSLERTKITDAGTRWIGDCPKVERLSLALTSIGDASLEHLARLPRLRELNVADTRLTESGFAKVVQLPSLAEVTVSGDYLPASIKDPFSAPDDIHPIPLHNVRIKYYDSLDAMRRIDPPAP